MGVGGRNVSKNWPHYTLKATHLTELLNMLQPPNFKPSSVFEPGSQNKTKNHIKWQGRHIKDTMSLPDNYDRTFEGNYGGQKPA
jgi:hypothetical protein